MYALANKQNVNISLVYVIYICF